MPVKVTFELEGNIYDGDNIVLCSGTRKQCLKAFERMTVEEKLKYYFISLQPYSESERLDDDEVLYFNENTFKNL